MTKSGTSDASEPSAKSSLINWEQFRAEMPICRRWAYFDHAAVAPLPKPAESAVVAWSEQAAALGDTCWPQWSQRIERLRGRFSQLISATTKEIALIPNTTTGIHLVAEGFPWRAGDGVVFPEDEFPSNAYPWLNLASRGVVPIAVPRPDSGWTTDALIDACDETTRLISVSWIGYASGYRLDLEELIDRAHQRGILVFIDAIQGLGVYPIHVSALKADFLAADGHKWLLGPEGAGMLFIAERHLDLLRPLIAGWNSVESAQNFDDLTWKPKQSASRYEGGSQNMVGFAGLDASVELLQSAGAGPDSQRMADRIRELASETRELLLSAGANFDPPRSSNHDSGILPFDIPGSDPASFRNRCLDGGVVLSVRGGRLRISPHVYNNREDLDRLTEIVRDQVRNPLSS